MKREYNYQSFTPDEVEQGLLQDLLNYLLDHNKKNKNQYYDIHLTTDGYVSIVEWTDVSYNRSYGPDGHFAYVPAEGTVMIEKQFPDDHYEMCFDEQDYQERLQEFLEKNPGWHQTAYGCWTNDIENEKFTKELKGDKNG